VVDLNDANNAAELWLLIVCGALFVLFIVTLIVARRTDARIKRGEWRHAHHVAKVRQQARNGFKSRSAT
jgi:hypothetical protein